MLGGLHQHICSNTQPKNPLYSSQYPKVIVASDREYKSPSAVNVCSDQCSQLYFFPVQPLPSYSTQHTLETKKQEMLSIPSRGICQRVPHSNTLDLEHSTPRFSGLVFAAFLM